MSSINGIGSGFVGCSEVGRDGSFITTEWVILLFPVVPIRSFRVLPTSHINLGFYSRSKFQSQRVPLYWPHVIWVYATYLAAAIFFLASDPLTGPRLSRSVSSPLLASVLAFAFAMLAVWISGFIRKASLFASLIVFGFVITVSLLIAANISVQPERSWQYMYWLWGAYAIYFVSKFFRNKEPAKTQKRARR